MNVYRGDFVSLKDYLEIRENSEELLEYIDGYVYMTPSPSVQHQRISGKLYVKFSQYLDGKPCEVFHAPMDVELKAYGSVDSKVVIPDISVICEKEGFTQSKYVGVPSLIVEILSPSNQSHDLITKLNLYMNCGVKEYWIVNPMLSSVTVYALNEDGLYIQHDLSKDTGVISSMFLKGFSVDLEEIFGGKKIK